MVLKRKPRERNGIIINSSSKSDIRTMKLESIGHKRIVNVDYMDKEMKL